MHMTENGWFMEHNPRKSQPEENQISAGNWTPQVELGKRAMEEDTITLTLTTEEITIIGKAVALYNLSGGIPDTELNASIKIMEQIEARLIEKIGPELYQRLMGLQ